MDFQSHQTSLASQGSGENFAAHPEIDNQSLCDCCRAMFSGAFNTTQPHHTSVDELIRCGEHECLLCAGLWNIVAKENKVQWIAADRAARSSNDNLSSQIYSLIKWPSSEDVHIGFWSQNVPWGRSYVDSVELRFTFRQLFDGYKEAPLRRPRESFESTFTKETQHFISENLAECLGSHENCEAGHSEPWLPTRLVEVPGAGQSVRLVLGESLPERTKYATLSHCWGDSPTLQLKQSLLPQFSKEIPLADIPLTYQDAFSVAASLGVRHVWIDSMCIIQDSTEDWNRECSTMCEVYQNGFCNIVALDATDSHGGCIRKRDAATLKPITVKSNWDIEEIYNTENGLWIWRFQGVPLNVYQELDDSAIHRRGWVLQERTLSPRNIHFGRHMVYWECRTRLDSETMDTGYGEYSKAWKPCIVSSRQRNIEVLTEDSKIGYLLRWASLVASYTNGALTNPDDKLVAISALAKEFQAIFDRGTDETFRYLAGLWSRFLLQQIVWHRQNAFLTQPPRYRAPSWSWASVDGPLRFACTRWEGHQWKNTILAEIVDVTVKPFEVNHYFGVHSGSLQMRCWLWPLRGESSSMMLLLDHEDYTAGENTYLLPVKVYKYQRLSPQNHNRNKVCGLVVEKLGAIFQRVGYFEYPIMSYERGFQKVPTSSDLDVEWVTKVERLVAPGFVHRVEDTDDLSVKQVIIMM